jgi:hypothetical protein
LLLLFISLKGIAKIGIETQNARERSEIICGAFKRVVFWQLNEGIIRI